MRREWRRTVDYRREGVKRGGKERERLSEKSAGCGGVAGDTGGDSNREQHIQSSLDCLLKENIRIHNPHQPMTNAGKAKVYR